MSAKIFTKAMHLVGFLAFVCPIVFITTTPNTLERISGLEIPFYNSENKNSLRTTQPNCKRPNFDFHFTDDATVDQPLCVHNRVVKPRMLSTNLGRTAVACGAVDADDSTEVLTVELLLSLRNGMFGGADDSGRDCNAFCVFNLVDTQPSHFRWSRLSQCWRKTLGHNCMGATPSEIKYAANLKASLCSISQSLLTARTVVDQHSYDDDMYITPTPNDVTNKSILPVDSAVNEDPRRQHLTKPSPAMMIVTGTVDADVWTIAANVKTNATKLSRTQQEDKIKTSHYFQRSKRW
eukprot:m.12805 g.12805  ORF g.12805 m.12805 type:complete len:293 (+) comp9459_c0_seq1:395-1273(+)